MATRTYGTVNVTARVGKIGKEVYGIFYHANIRHVGKYIPYSSGYPQVALCGYSLHTCAATRSIDFLCPDCLKHTLEIFGELRFT